MGFFDFLSTPGPTQTQTNSSDAFSQPYWQQYLSGLNTTLGNNPITPYGGPTVAPQNFMQQTANDMGYNLATGGSPAGNMANSAIVAQASGAIANPYATTLNPYLGTNPYTNQVIDQTNNRIADAYARGTAAQTDSAFNQAGAYGGSAYKDQVANNERSLGDALALNTSNQLNQNFYNNANLAENQLNRASGAFQNQSQNQLQAAGLGLQSQGVDWNAINNLANLGYGQQQNTQNVLGAMQNYYTQSQLAPFTGYDLMGNALSRYSAANNVSTAQGSPTSGVTNLLGGLGALYTLFGG